MVAKRKIIMIIFASLIILGFAYFFIVNWSIWYRIGLAGLQAHDTNREFIFNEQKANSSMIYAALGDSLTSGVGASDYKESFPYLIAEKLSESQPERRIRHLNFSYPGARTEDLINDLLPGVLAAKPDIVTLLIGVNDVHGQVSEEKFQKNYDFILSELTSKTTAKINVISLPNMCVSTLFLPPFNHYYKSRTETFNVIINDLSNKYNVNYIDLTTPTARYSTKAGEYYSADQFHPSGMGYRLWAQIIYDNLNQ